MAKPRHTVPTKLSHDGPQRSVLAEVSWAEVSGDAGELIDESRRLRERASHARRRAAELTVRARRLHARATEVCGRGRELLRESRDLAKRAAGARDPAFERGWLQSVLGGPRAPIRPERQALSIPGKLLALVVALVGGLVAGAPPGAPRARPSRSRSRADSAVRAGRLRIASGDESTPLSRSPGPRRRAPLPRVSPPSSTRRFDVLDSFGPSTALEMLSHPADRGALAPRVAEWRSCLLLTPAARDRDRSQSAGRA